MVVRKFGLGCLRPFTMQAATEQVANSLLSTDTGVRRLLLLGEALWTDGEGDSVEVFRPAAGAYCDVTTQTQTFSRSTFYPEILLITSRLARRVIVYRKEPCRTENL